MTYLDTKERGHCYCTKSHTNDYQDRHEQISAVREDGDDLEIKNMII